MKFVSSDLLPIFWKHFVFQGKNYLKTGSICKEFYRIKNLKLKPLKFIVKINSRLVPFVQIFIGLKPLLPLFEALCPVY